MLPKKGIVLPNEATSHYARAVAHALRKEVGTTHQAVKTVQRWTGAGERTVKNWLVGVSGPSGQHLVELIRRSDAVLEILLVLAGRQELVTAKKCVDARDKIAEILRYLDALIENAGDTS